MASEDSVENLCLRDPSVLAVAIDGVGESDELYEPLTRAMKTLAYKVHHVRKDLVVHYARRKAHVVPEERNHSVPEDLAVRDLQDQYGRISRFREDRARPKLLRSHFQESPPVPVLIQEELRLDEVAEGGGPMSLQRHANAAFSFNEAG
jgi:hypothetical protein